MLSSLLELTALPNLHPALVHFPIALAAVALAFDGVAFLRRTGPGAAVVLWWGAAAGALAAHWTGEDAATSLPLPAAEVELAIAAHADWAWWTLLALAGVALLRTLALWLEPGRRGAFGALGLLAGLGVQGAVARTADLGGALVFRHGVHVERPEPARPHDEGAASLDPAAPDLVRLPDGSWRFTPRPGDPSVLGRVLQRESGEALQVEVFRSSEPGQHLRVSGQGRLLLPGEFSDLRIEVDVGVAAFDGSIAVAALESAGGGGLAFERAADGSFVLARLRRGEREVVDQAAPGSASRLTLSLSAVRGHWKAHVGERALLHAHGSLSAPLRPALLLSGSGELTLYGAGASVMGR